MRSFASIVLLVLIVNIGAAQTVSGVVTSDTTWTIGSSPITVTGTVTVNLGVTLTIDPGVVVKFNGGTALVVSGKIAANGTSVNPIRFTSSAGSPAPGDWNGIELRSTTNVGSVINRVIVEYAGAGPNASALFYITGAYSIPITNSTFRLNSTHGINTRASSPRIGSSTFDRNGGYGIYSDLLSNFVIDSCMITNNATGGIHVSVNASWNSSTQTGAAITNSVIDTNGIGIYLDNNCFPLVQNNMIRKNATGIQFTGLGSTQPTIVGNSIYANTVWGFRNTSTSTVRAERNYWGSAQGPYHPAYNPTGLGNPVSDFVDFQPWNIQGAALPVISITANIASPTLWSAGSVYWVKNNIAVNNGIVLTIAPGTIVKFAPSARLSVNGAIVANGRADSLIVFTSDKDDGYGGDSNGDGIASGPNPGDWDMLYLIGGQNSSSVLNECVIKFGGSSGNGNIDVNSASPVLNSVFCSNGSNYGFTVYNSSSNFTNCVVGGNGYRGVYMSNTTTTISHSSFSTNGNVGIWADGTSRLTLQSSSISKNGSSGMNIDGGTGSKTTVVLLDSCTVAGNNGWGLYNWAASGAQTISNSRFSDNAAGGVWTFNVDDVVHFNADTVLNNADDGIVTSHATITNNVIQGNRYPIALIGRVNTTYAGNTITGNRMNNALALRVNRSEESLSDTLKMLFPAGMTSGTYVFVDNSANQGILAGQTLVIQPGLIFKVSSAIQFNVYGTLVANGTKTSPIVFTSWRDNSFGGKTTASTDTLPPAAGDWQYVRIDGGSAVNSIVRNCILKYGGYNGYGTFWLNNLTLVAPIDSTIIRRSSNYGSYTSNVVASFTNCTIDTNSSYGMYIDGSSPRSDITVKNTIVQDNGSIGLYAGSNATYREVSNCIVRRNNGTGIQIGNGTIPQVFVGNTIANNNGHGVYTYSPSISAPNVAFIGNTFSDNFYEGVFSSAARFVDNKFLRNRYPFGVLGHLGNIYTDNNGVDGNRFNGNRFNNAIAIAGSSYAPLSDTLKYLFPDSITSHTYVAVENIQVSGGMTLLIQPGVILKFQKFPPGYSDMKRFDVYGTLLANGTPGSPIIFTSWRDSTVGGKTAAATEYGLAPGDWDAVYLRNGAGASIIRNCRFLLGGVNGNGQIYYESNLAGLVFSNNLVRRSSGYGIYVNNTALTIDSTTIDSCGHNGLYVGSNAGNLLTLRNSRINANGYYGVFAEGNARVALIQNTAITNSRYTGLYIQNNTVPSSIVGNTVSNNGDHGIYVLSRNDAYDTLLTIAGNKVRNNRLFGIASSRAFVVDDSITGNRYPIGVLGQISLDGTSTAAGNIYQGGYIAGNTFNTVLATEGTIFGRLGLSFPYTDTANVVAVRTDVLVPSGSTLSIAPGSIIKFPRESGNGRFEIQGLLKSEGTTNKKIVFTSWRDDSYGGDANADSNATLPSPGDWDMLYLNAGSNSASHVLQTIIRYGGYTGNGNLDVYNNACPVDTSFFSYSSNYGVYLNSANSPLTGNEFHHNPTGILLGGSSSPVISRSNIHDNANYGLNNQTTITVDARNNYWGSASGPFVNQGADQNLSGLGNRIGINPGAVTYRPFSATRSGILLGDVSGNGTISAYDASLVLQYLVALTTLSPAQLAAADVSGDGTVSAYDASYILRYSVGLVTGFPGLGKRTGTAAIASSYELKPRAGSSPDEFELVLHLKGTAPILASELQVSFDQNEIAFVGLGSSSLADSLVSTNRSTEQSVAVALAGTVPVQIGGDLVRLTFKAKHGIGRNWSSDLHVTRFVLNETDLTTTAPAITIDMQTIKGVPTEFQLSQNYPNPFNPTTTIEYQLPTTGAVSVKVYDGLGKQVAVLVDREERAGYYAVAWNGRNTVGQSVASGIYFYRLQAVGSDGRAIAKVHRMLLLK